MAATDKNSHPHWKIKGDKLSVKAIGDKKTKDEMNLSQALMQAKRELYPGKDYHLLSSEENMDVTIRARDILRESKKTKDEMKFKKADVPDDQFDPIQLKMGIEVENEHTDDPEIAKAIAKAHLSEIGDYYTRLKKMEAEAGVKDEKIFGKSWEQIQAMQQGTYRPKLIKPIAGKDYGADPLGNGKFKMVPSGDIVDFEERNRRLK